MHCLHARQSEAGGSCQRRGPGRKTGLGKAPRRWPRRGGKGKQQQGSPAASTLSSSAHRALLHQPALGQASQQPRVVLGEGIGCPPPKTLTSSRGPCSTRARALPKLPRGCCPQQRPGKERAESSPMALLEAAQTHLHSACGRHPETACAGEQQGYPESPGQDPEPVPAAALQGLAPRGQRGFQRVSQAPRLLLCIWPLLASPPRPPPAPR